MLICLECQSRKIETNGESAHSPELVVRCCDCNAQRQPNCENCGRPCIGEVCDDCSHGGQDIDESEACNA